MKVSFIGFGGYTEYPCYEDEKGKLYFDINDGRNGLALYTGAYRDKYGDIDGEPCYYVVLDNMDRETWLSGIGRATFHWSAARETRDGKTIFFDASKLFK